MSKYIKVSICGGTSPGPFTIYYDTIGPRNIANHFLPLPILPPYPQAVNVTLAELTDIVNYYVVEVPDTAQEIILVDVNNLCDPIVQMIPRPSPTPTLTPTVTPTITPNTIIVNVQFVIDVTNIDYLGFMQPGQILLNGQSFTNPFYGPLTLLPSNVIPNNDYKYGLRFPAANVDVVPAGLVQENGGLVSNSVVLPGRYTGPLTYQFCFWPLNTSNNLDYRVYIFQNGILRETMDRTTYNNNPNGGVVYRENTNNIYTINNSDAIQITITNP